MSSSGSEAKTYVDRGVQVGSPALPAISLQEELIQKEHDTSLCDITSSAINISQVSYSSAYTQSSQGSPSPLTAERVLKPPQLPANRPSSSHINPESSRIVSLPETAPLFTGKRALKGSMRVVSMPDRVTPGGFSTDNSLSSSDRIDVSVYSGESYTSMEDDNSGTRLSHSHQDVPHTPSPPSSPDSILIIENNGELSEAFLRPRVEDVESDSESEKAAHDEDNGWITWARSPPRPIPALHGPLSLPYARCPSSISGAEGTIIEEPENLPRMIWGLETEDQVVSHSGSDPYDLDQRTAHGKPARIPDQPSLHSTPKKQHEDRFASQQKRPHPVSIQRHQQFNRPQEPFNRPQEPVKEEQYANQQNLDEVRTERYPRGLFDDAIVLENLLREDGAARNLWMSGGNPQANTTASQFDTKAQHGYASGLNQRFTRSDQGYGPANVARTQNTGLGNMPSEFLPSSSTMKVTTRPALGCALPQILIEPRSPHNLQVPSRRPSAIEIARQYRQQHMQKQQGGFLPTPPNSSSPLWSSDFSPYQESMLSPSESLSQLSGLPMSTSHSQFLNAGGSSEQLSRQLLQSMNDLAMDMGMASLAPAAQINSASRLRVPALNIHNLFSSQASDNNQVARNNFLSSTPSAMPSSQELRSLSRTSAPPNRGMVHAPAEVRAPPSPTSPEVVRKRTPSQPQPRSIPLARLMQRRLSAVPEEDAASTVRGNSPSPARHASGLPGTGAARARNNNAGVSSRAYTDARVHLPASKGVPMQARPANSRPVQGNLTTQSRPAEQALGDLYGEGAASGARVRLPSSPSQARDENAPGGRPHQGGRGRYEGGRGEQREHAAPPARGFGRKKMRGRGRKAFGGPSNANSAVKT
ncbi:hypothetical protein EVG20_g2384 [Dentipellis fragilis]|uniref:Uncharacterized protein n=1 Tax=Dentipellis fragilis TaxID=205917 RepID=A0A4Y9ZB69_9AGAM|nr:hypothetical protein EVG20_g2384 [Dentipellis fragilis]